jgi:ankyrin repeat protein
MTPLHIAVYSGSGKIVAKLIKANADKSLRDHQNQTPLDLAKDNGFTSIQGILEHEDGILEQLNIK